MIVFFNIEEKYDHLYIFEGSSTNANYLRAELTGKLDDVVQYHTYKKPEAVLWFKSDASGKGVGFQVDYFGTLLNGQCFDDEFTCEDAAGTCVPATARCDGKTDCSDYSDEKNCDCDVIYPDHTQADPVYFRCEEGSNWWCLPVSQWCDKFINCPGGQDELPDCQCLDNQYKCDGRCMAMNTRCDGFDDCLDGSDELNCGQCDDDEYQCSDKSCIPKNYVCDQYKDCDDYEDEKGNCGHENINGK